MRDHETEIQILLAAIELWRSVGKRHAGRMASPAKPSMSQDEMLVANKAVELADIAINSMKLYLNETTATAE